MKFFNISLIFLVCIASICLLNTKSVSADDGGDGAGAKRLAPRRPVGKSAKTTTTAAPADYDGDYAEGENPEQYGEDGEEIAQSSTTTTTEAPKKIGPVIRPFRSNDDFLNSLKRRQMDAKKHRAEKVAARSKPVENRNNNNNNNNDDDDEDSAPPASAPVSVKSSKPNQLAANRRKFVKPGKSQEQQEDTAAEGSENQQQEKEEEKSRRPHPRLALRKRA